ncbi:MAG: YkgJ family cysteine cluster protein [Pseudomonadota bacterium]
MPAHLHKHKVIACLEYDILVPFVCHRCGNCCRNYDPIIEMELLPEIARTLGEPISAIQDRLRVQSLSHSIGSPTDCCFLHPRHSGCIIYEVRPTACRQFPPLAGVGAGAVDCPGYRDYRSVLNKFTNRRERVPERRFTAARGQRQIPPHARRNIRCALTAAGVSDGYRQVFEEMNI